MSLRYKTNLLQHLQSIRTWLVEHGGQASMELADLQLHLTHGEQQVVLLPQYVGLREGKLFYSRNITPYTVGFVSWLPYASKSWPGSAQKLAFKEGMTRAGIRTPPYWHDVNEVDSPFIFKMSVSSFGYGIRGPYLPAHVRLMKLQMKEGEYAERFMFGRIGRAWYWNGELTVVELFDMPTVAGDGHSNFETLLKRRLGEMSEPPTESAQVARLQGFEPGDVIASGHRVIADYRYVSPLNPTAYENSNRRSELVGTTVEQQFRAGGRAAYALIPRETQPSMMFVLDAIVDADDRVWFLELNSNSQVHPDFYPYMLGSLFGLPAGD
jgi:hypothetical protein